MNLQFYNDIPSDLILVFPTLPSGNPKCDPKTWSQYDDDCCSVEEPCGLGQGDCDVDIECAGDLICGENNCGVEFTNRGADCCQLKGQ